MSLLKLLSVLMDYPQDALWDYRQELLAAADAAALTAPRRQALRDFSAALLDRDPLEAQDGWLCTFDRGRAMSLLLFEHIHGESRDRGQAMVDLVEAYRRGGFELAARELPDYLPLLLEYLDQRPEEEARDWLRHLGPIVGLLAARAAERGSAYALLFELLLEYAGGQVDLGLLRRRAGAEPRDDGPEAMDRLWEEEAVRFGAQAPGEACGPSPRSSAVFRATEPSP